MTQDSVPVTYGAPMPIGEACGVCGHGLSRVGLYQLRDTTIYDVGTVIVCTHCRARGIPVWNTQRLP